MLIAKRSKRVCCWKSIPLSLFPLVQELAIICGKGSGCHCGSTGKDKWLDVLWVKFTTALVASYKEHYFYGLCTEMAQLQHWWHIEELWLAGSWPWQTKLHWPGAKWITCCSKFLVVQTPQDFPYPGEATVWSGHIMCSSWVFHTTCYPLHIYSWLFCWKEGKYHGVSATT